VSRAVNLIPSHRLECRRQRRRIQLWCVGCSGYGVVLGGLWLSVCVWYGSPDQAIAADLITVEARISDVSAAIDQLQPRLAAAEAMLAASGSIGHRADWTALLTLLADLLDDRTVLSACHLAPLTGSTGSGPARDYALTLSGLARSHADASAYVLRLEESGLFDRVQLLDTRTELFVGERAVAFRIACAIHERPLAGESGR